MSQEGDHRDAPGGPPDEPGTDQPSGGGGWSAPGQGAPPPAEPSAGRPGFAPPEEGPAPGFAAPGHQQPGFTAPGHQQPGFAAPGQGAPAHGGHAPYPGHAPFHGGPRVPKPGVVALRPMTLGDILNGAFSLIRNNPKTTVGLSLVVMAVASIVSSIGFGGYMSDYGVLLDQAMTDPAAVDPNDPLPFSTWSLVAMYGGALLTYAGTTLVTGLLTAVVGMAVLGHKLSPAQAWAAVKDRIGAVVGLALLQLLIFFGLTLVILVVGVVGLFLGLFLAVSGNQTVGVIVIALSVVLGFLGGLALASWIYVRLYLAMPVVVLERLGVGASLARSWRLTRGSWWRVFGIVLVATLLIGLVGGLLSTPFSLVAAIPSIFAPGEAWAAVAAGALIYVGDVLISSVTAPFTVGVATLLYVDLRMRREGLDLRLHEAARTGREVGPQIYLPEPRT